MVYSLELPAEMRLWPLGEMVPPVPADEEMT